MRPSALGHGLGWAERDALAPMQFFDRGNGNRDERRQWIIMLGAAPHHLCKKTHLIEPFFLVCADDH
jgi:hypothetical protein